MRTSCWLLGFILGRKVFCKALFCFLFLFAFPSAQGAGFVGLPLSACPCSWHGSCVLGPSVASVGKARVTFLPRLCTGELVQTLFVSWVCFHLLMVSLLLSFLDLSKPRNLKAKHHWNTIWFHIKTALPRQSSARASVSLAACNCTLSLAPAQSGWFGGILHSQILGKYTKTQGTRPAFKNWANSTTLSNLWTVIFTPSFVFCVWFYETTKLPYLFKMIGQELLSFAPKLIYIYNQVLQKRNTYVTFFLLFFRDVLSLFFSCWQLCEGFPYWIFNIY